MPVRSTRGTAMAFTAEELAIYGVIDADTYLQLSEAVITGTTTMWDTFPRMDDEVCERIRARAAQWLRQRMASEPDESTDGFEAGTAMPG
jgi:hypothetical protein